MNDKVGARRSSRVSNDCYKKTKNTPCFNELISSNLLIYIHLRVNKAMLSLFSRSRLVKHWQLTGQKKWCLFVMKSQFSTMKIITYLNEINENANVCKYWHVRQAKGRTMVNPGIHPTLEINNHENANVINSEFRSMNRKGKINIRTQKKESKSQIWLLVAFMVFKTNIKLMIWKSWMILIHTIISKRYLLDFIIKYLKLSQGLLFPKNILCCTRDILWNCCVIENPRESQKEYRHKQSRIVLYSLLALLHMTNLYGLWR